MNTGMTVIFWVLCGTMGLMIGIYITFRSESKELRELSEKVKSDELALLQEIEDIGSDELRLTSAGTALLAHLYGSENFPDYSNAIGNLKPNSKPRDNRFYDNRPVKDRAVIMAPPSVTRKDQLMVAPLPFITKDEQPMVVPQYRANYSWIEIEDNAPVYLTQSVFDGVRYRPITQTYYVKKHPR